MKNLKFAISFLTCIPADVMDADDRSWLKSLIFYPLCGYLISLLLLLILYFLKYFLFSNPVILSALAVLIIVYLSRGLHLDGLADVCDSFFCPVDKSKRLEIMKDPRVGSFGVIGICVLLLVKFAAISAVIESGYIYYLLPAIVLSRFIIVFLASIGRAATDVGLGAKIIGRVPARILFISFICTLPCFFISFKVFFAFVLLLIFTFILNLRSKKLIGGINGDVLGTACEISEVLVLLVLSCR